jgi:hypothetical protein
MATLNAYKWGRAARTAQTSHANARDGTTATAILVNPTAGSYGMRYERQAGRSSTVYHVYRTFYYFDTSGITGNVTNSSLNILGSTDQTATVIIVPSTAFGGDGSANLIADDFNNVTFDLSYGAAFSGWDDGLNNSMNLRNHTDAEGVPNAAIRDNPYFICAVIEYTYDYGDTSPGSATIASSGINHATAAYLDYTEASSGYANDVIGVATANIGKVLGVATANIGKVIGV